MVAHLLTVDERLGRQVADGLAMHKLPAPARPAVPVRDDPPSPALSLVGRMKDTLDGRCVGALVAEGSDARALAALRKAVEGEGAALRVVAPKIEVALGDGKRIVVDGQLEGTPSVVFDAVAILLSNRAAATLSAEKSALDFARDAFAHLKAIGMDAGGERLLAAAGIESDAGIIDLRDTASFVRAARTRHWERESQNAVVDKEPVRTGNRM
jgi:catalase